MRAVNCRDHLSASGILDIFHSVSAQKYRPVDFSVGCVLLKSLFIQLQSAVKFIRAAVILGALNQRCFCVAADFGKSLRTSAEFAHCGSLAFIYMKCAAAHFTSELLHFFPPEELFI